MDSDIRDKFDELGVQLQRAVGEALGDVEPAIGQTKTHVVIPREAWQAIVEAYDAIGAYASEIASAVVRHDEQGQGSCTCGHKRAYHDSDWGLDENAPANAEPASCDIEGCMCETFTAAAK